ncbi:MAG TPA: thiamine pyrophosphate-dependent enzyme, partial [Pseudobdellovibrionaceae bacterium]|nr:thiamine pyrophosphate-dependent enzyme [Pseudobdellovibrionaceae bacterium]
MQNDNLDYLESMYSKYLSAPQSLSSDWKYFFEGVQFGEIKSSGSKGALSSKELDVYNLINAYRNLGHIEANTNPLKKPKITGELELSKFNLSETELQQKFQIGRLIGKENATLSEIINQLKQSYCGTLTVQCAEATPQIRDWFFKRLESPSLDSALKTDDKKELLNSLTRAESLEKFIHTRYVGTKRFSIEGGDVLLPMLETLIQNCTAIQAKEIMIGMAHRGRVNLLSNLMGKGLEYIFADFNGPTEMTEPLDDFDGDVKYHLGYTNTKDTPHGPCKVSLAYNPSHLEAVNPVLLGMVRAAQRRRKDTAARKTVIPVLIHGDAAFASQGVILETFQMAQVKGYTVGGTIHIIVDNQIGFTANPESSRSSFYSSDVGKVLATPVLHINADDPEACIKAMDMALKYRQEFGRDIVINLICYRRFGHNEGDEPAYTQPLMYEFIRKHPTVRE